MNVHVSYPDGHRKCPWDIVTTLFEIEDEKTGEIVDSYRFSLAAGDEDYWWHWMKKEYCND